MIAILDYIFDWLPFGLGVSILIGTGFVLLADEFKAFKAARVCFYLATAWIYGKALMWAYFTSDRFQVRGVVAFLVFGFVGMGLSEALRLTSHREQPPQPHEAVEGPNTPKKPEAPPSSAENQSQQNNNEAHGTTAKHEAKPQRHGTDERTTTKVEHPSSPSSPPKESGGTKEPLPEVEQPPKIQQVVIADTREIPSRWEDAPYGIQLIITTTAKIDGVKVSLLCDVPIKRSYPPAYSGFHGGVTSTIVSEMDKRVYTFAIFGPPFTPQYPISVMLFGDQPIRNCQIVKWDPVQ